MFYFILGLCLLVFGFTDVAAFFVVLFLGACLISFFRR